MGYRERSRKRIKISTIHPGDKRNFADTGDRGLHIHQSAPPSETPNVARGPIIMIDSAALLRFQKVVLTRAGPSARNSTTSPENKLFHVLVQSLGHKSQTCWHAGDSSERSTAALPIFSCSLSGHGLRDRDPECPRFRPSI